MSKDWLSTRPTAALGPDRENRMFSAAELAEDAGITVRAVRLYEQKGLLHPRKVGNTRVYTYRDRARLELILRGKRVGSSLEEIGEFLALYDVDGGKVAQLDILIDQCGARITRLEAQREDIDRMVTDLRDLIRAAQDRRQELLADGEPTTGPPKRRQASG